MKRRRARPAKRRIDDLDTYWQSTVHDRLTCRRHAEAFAQRRDTTAAQWYFSSFVFSSYHIVNSVCSSHALVSGSTSKRTSSDEMVVYVVGSYIETVDILFFIRTLPSFHGSTATGNFTCTYVNYLYHLYLTAIL